MSSETAGSVTKGVFVFKGKQRKVQAEDYIDHQTPDALERHEAFLELWASMQNKVQMINMKMHSFIFKELLNFVKSSHSDDTSSVAKIVREIPTAALITGVNLPDHEGLFEDLQSLLRDEVSPHIAVLKSNDCTNTRTAVTSCVTQLMDTQMVLDEDEETVAVSGGRGVHYTMDVLTAWYQEQSQRQTSPDRKRKSCDNIPSSPRKSPRKCSKTANETGMKSPRKRAAVRSLNSPPKQSVSKCKPLVIVLEDLEGFPAHVLQDFVAICGNHLDVLPLVLIFGIATTVASVHRLLPHEFSSLLCMEKFQAPPPTECLNELIDQLLLTPSVAFRLSGRVFRLFIQLFLYHDFSTVSFVRAFKLAMLEHFTESSASVLCHCEDVESKLKSFSSSELDAIRSLRSFRRYVECQPPEEQITLLEDDKHAKAVISQMLKNLTEYHAAYFPILRCLHALTTRLPGQPMGKHLREIYALNLSTDIGSIDEYTEAISISKALCHDELVAILKQCHECLDNNDVPESLLSFKEEVNAYVEKFDSIQDVDDVEEEKEVDKVESRMKKMLKMDMVTLKKTLQEKKKKKLSAYELLRIDAIQFLNSTFRKHLRCPLHLPLLEIQYHSKASSLRSHLNASPRACIQSALIDPFQYTQNPALKCQNGVISPNLPDLCVVYLLHAECGRLINLYDWLQSFSTIVTAGSEDKPSQHLQARFIRAVSELQFLGFVKPTKRKTDHVARLTWGGC